MDFKTTDKIKRFAYGSYGHRLSDKSVEAVKILSHNSIFQKSPTIRARQFKDIRFCDLVRIARGWIEVRDFIV